jgi:hypothetical protein
MNHVAYTEQAFSFLFLCLSLFPSFLPVSNIPSEHYADGRSFVAIFLLRRSHSLDQICFRATYLSAVFPLAFQKIILPFSYRKTHPFYWALYIQETRGAPNLGFLKKWEVSLKLWHWGIVEWNTVHVFVTVYFYTLLILFDKLVSWKLKRPFTGRI